MKFKMLTLLLSAGLALAACGNTDDNNEKKDEAKTTKQSESKNAENKNADGKEIAVDYKDITVKPHDAIKKAHAAAPGAGPLKEIALEHEDGKWLYTVKFQKDQTETKVKVYAEENKVLSSTTETEDDNDKTFEYQQFVPIEDIIKTAEGEFAGLVKEWSLADDDGTVVYEVAMQNDAGDSKDIKIDAQTNKVISD